MHCPWWSANLIMLGSRSNCLFPRICLCTLTTEIRCLWWYFHSSYFDLTHFPDPGIADMHPSLWAFSHGFLKLNLFSHVCMASTALAEDPETLEAVCPVSQCHWWEVWCWSNCLPLQVSHGPQTTSPLPIAHPAILPPKLGVSTSGFHAHILWRKPHPTLLHSCRIPRLSAAPCTMQSCRHRVTNLREPHSGGCDQSPKKPAFLLFLFKHNGDGGPVEPISPHINQS